MAVRAGCRSSPIQHADCAGRRLVVVRKAGGEDGGRPPRAPKFKRASTTPNASFPGSLPTATPSTRDGRRAAPGGPALLQEGTRSSARCADEAEHEIESSAASLASSMSSRASASPWIFAKRRRWAERAAEACLLVGVTLGISVMIGRTYKGKIRFSTFAFFPSARAYECGPTSSPCVSSRRLPRHLTHAPPSGKLTSIEVFGGSLVKFSTQSQQTDEVVKPERQRE